MYTQNELKMVNLALQGEIAKCIDKVKASEHSYLDNVKDKETLNNYYELWQKTRQLMDNKDIKELDLLLISPDSYKENDEELPPW